MSVIEQSQTPQKPAERRYVPSKETLSRWLELLKGGQKFHHNHFKGDHEFAEGLRPYARYRELGVAEATGGLVQAHVIRTVPPCTDEARSNHYHDTCFQMIYVLKGWEKIWVEGHGEIVMQPGSVWIQPPKINHRVLDYSDDLEVLEIILPAEFATVDNK
jgi:mannose-6-phosphate isomerase-like protein (cupin superfamily)